MNLKSLVRGNIQSLSPYKSARNEFKGKAEIFIDANENPYENGYNRYPDPNHLALKSELAILRKISPSNIMLGNGSDEIIDLLIRIFCNPGLDTVYTFEPSFGMFDVAAAINDIKIFKHKLDNAFKLDIDGFLRNIPSNCKIIFLCSPNNPTGNSLPLKDVEIVLKVFKGVVVVDEAYIDFSDHESGLTLLDSYSNLVVIQTFSKAIGAAGLRIGMAFADPYIIQLLSKVKMPYNISKANQQIGLDRLLNNSIIKKEIQLIKAERKRVENKLSNNRLIQKIYSSDANFLLIKIENAETVYRELIEKGVVVRNRSSLFGCHNCLRITIGTEEENNVLLKFFETKNNMNKI
jgi:histidinol-phosphate aminotransferase